MNHSTLLLSLASTVGACLLGSSPAVGQAQFIDLSGQVDAVTDITPDGETIVGYGSGGSFIWKWQQDPAPTYIGGNYAVAVSDDAAVVAGNIPDATTGANVAAIWTQAGGWQSLGFLPFAQQCPSLSTCYDISADGTTVIGLSWDGCDARGFRWTQATGMLELQSLVNGTNRATAIAADGSLMVGFAQGNFSRTPTTWLPNTTGQAFDPEVVGECLGVNSDGSMIVGVWDGEAFYHDGTTLTTFGSLLPGWSGNAVTISESGERIVGYDSLGLGKEAWVWSQADGIEQLTTKLTALGAANVPASIGRVMAMTPDGSIIVGDTAFSGGWIVLLPVEVEPYCTAKVTSIGCLPQIGHTGVAASATSSGPFDVTASQTMSLKTGLMFYGLGQATIPFNGGTLCVLPPLGRTSIQFSGGAGNTCTGSYSYDFQALIQSGNNPLLVPGANIYSQYWFRDPADLFGVGLTNALAFEIQI